MLMMDATEKKFEIQNKLEKEAQNFKLLKEKFEKSSQLTQGMIGILSTFEHRLARLEETILPVYNETGNLQRKQENIEQTLIALDHVIAFYSVSQDVQSIINAGPGPTLNGNSGLNNFLEAMDKLQAAIEYFDKNNPQSVELQNVTSLFKEGGDLLNREFKDLLFKHSRHISPITLMDLVVADEDTSAEESPQSLHHFPDSVQAELIRISEWLITHEYDEFMNVYARVRATVVSKSLQQLKEHQKGGSGGSMQGINASLNSPMVSRRGSAQNEQQRSKFQSRLETPNRRASKRLQHVFERKANKMLLKASQTLEHSTGLTLGSRRSGLLSEQKEDVVDEQEMENYLMCVMALNRVMQSERNLMVGIIPLQHQHQVFEIIVKDSMDQIVQDGENIAARAKKCINRNEFAAVLVVFPILKHLLAMRPEFEKTVEGCDINVRSKFASILNTLHTTGAKALEDFIESVKSEPSTLLPKDGTVHELTSNVLLFIEQLLDYIETIGGVLAKHQNYSSALLSCSNAAKIDKNKLLLGIYIKKVLAQLNLTLINKSELYSDVFLRSVFRLNNNNYVLKSLQRSGLMELVQLSEPDCEESYNELICENKKTYIQSWGRVTSHISGLDEISTFTVAGKLRDKDRNLIKEKFSGFNKEMEEIAKIQRGYSIPDVELREGLKRDNKEYILPKYNAFHERFNIVNFTKNPEKYIKYTPAQISEMIDRFFDVAA